MNLQFDSMDELDQFLKFAGYRKSTDVAIQQVLHVVERTPVITGVDTADTPEAANIHTDTPPATEVAPAEKPKRRTKAQIAADEAAATAAETEPTERGGHEFPFKVGTTDQATETVQSALPTADQTQADAKPDDAAAHAWINPRAQELLMTGVAADAPGHLTAARNLIGTVGHAWYPESFRLIGAPLNASIINFTDEQRAHHLAAIEWMTARPGVYKL